VPIKRPGAYALEREVEHVLADLVGTEDVVAAAQRNEHAEQQQDGQQRQRHGADRRTAGADFQHFHDSDAAQPAPQAATSSSQTTSPPAQPRETRMAMSNS
jgi:hypothetical protein